MATDTPFLLFVAVMSFFQYADEEYFSVCPLSSSGPAPTREDSNSYLFENKKLDSECEEPLLARWPLVPTAWMLGALIFMGLAIAYRHKQ